RAGSAPTFPHVSPVQRTGQSTLFPALSDLRFPIAVTSGSCLNRIPAAARQSGSVPAPCLAPREEHRFLAWSSRAGEFRWRPCLPLGIGPGNTTRLLRTLLDSACAGPVRWNALLSCGFPSGACRQFLSCLSLCGVHRV